VRLRCALSTSAPTDPTSSRTGTRAAAQWQRARPKARKRRRRRRKQREAKEQQQQQQQQRSAHSASAEQQQRSSNHPRAVPPMRASLRRTRARALMTGSGDAAALRSSQLERAAWTRSGAERCACRGRSALSAPTTPRAAAAQARERQRNGSGARARPKARKRRRRRKQRVPKQQRQQQQQQQQQRRSAGRTAQAPSSSSSSYQPHPPLPHCPCGRRRTTNARAHLGSDDRQRGRRGVALLCAAPRTPRSWCPRHASVCDVTSYLPHEGMF
jgi:hypothetical protein